MPEIDDIRQVSAPSPAPAQGDTGAAAEQMPSILGLGLEKASFGEYQQI